MDSHAVQNQIKTYVKVFVALAVLTVVTVLASYLKVPLALTLLIGLTIATVKAALVAMYFMHLSHEKRIIIWILIATVFFFAVLMILPVITEHNA